MKPTEAWTEDSWDPQQNWAACLTCSKYSAEKRKEILSTMSKKAREEQKKLEVAFLSLESDGQEARKKEEEERKQQELKEEVQDSPCFTTVA